MLDSLKVYQNAFRHTMEKTLKKSDVFRSSAVCSFSPCSIKSRLLCFRHLSRFFVWVLPHTKRPERTIFCRTKLHFFNLIAGAIQAFHTHCSQHFCFCGTHWRISQNQFCAIFLCAWAEIFSVNRFVGINTHFPPYLPFVLMQA